MAKIKVTNTSDKDGKELVKVQLVESGSYKSVGEATAVDAGAEGEFEVGAGQQLVVKTYSEAAADTEHDEAAAEKTEGGDGAPEGTKDAA